MLPSCLSCWPAVWQDAIYRRYVVNGKPERLHHFDFYGAKGDFSSSPISYSAPFRLLPSPLLPSHSILSSTLLSSPLLHSPLSPPFLSSLRSTTLSFHRTAVNRKPARTAPTGVGLCKISLGSTELNLFVTHMHAVYNDNVGDQAAGIAALTRLSFC